MCRLVVTISSSDSAPGSSEVIRVLSLATPKPGKELARLSAKSRLSGEKPSVGVRLFGEGLIIKDSLFSGGVKGRGNSTAEPSPWFPSLSVEELTEFWDSSSGSSLGKSSTSRWLRRLLRTFGLPLPLDFFFGIAPLRKGLAGSDLRR